MTTSPFSLPVTVRPRTIAGAAPDPWAATSEIFGADGTFYFAIMSPHHAEYAAAIARAVNGEAKMVEALIDAEAYLSGNIGGPGQLKGIVAAARAAIAHAVEGETG